MSGNKNKFSAWRFIAWFTILPTISYGASRMCGLDTTYWIHANVATLLLMAAMREARENGDSP